MVRELERAYRAIEDYALLSNCEGCALVARDGSIDWACLERFDGDPTFSRLLDAGRGGWFAIRPDGAFETERGYVPGTMVLRTTFAAPAGVLQLHDFMLAEGAGDPVLVRIATPFE